MDVLLQPIASLFQVLLAPTAPFTWFGLPLSTLDIVATVRLCVVMRQLRDVAFKDHAQKTMTARRARKGKDKAREAGLDAYGDTIEDDLPEAPRAVEVRSFARDAFATLLVVFGGEIMSAPLLGIPPSFMLSGVGVGLYTIAQALIEMLPAVPAMGLESELPLALFDGMSRAYLLCNLIPPVVLGHRSLAVASSPWSLLLTSLITANGGFMLTNALSFLSPGPLTLTTPPELLPYGWTTADLWAAPTITGLYAFLTHAQPFWAHTHAALAAFLGAAALHPDAAARVDEKDPALPPASPGVRPMDPETARAACAIVLMCLFSGRAVKNFGGLKAVKSLFGMDASARSKKMQ